MEFDLLEIETFHSSLHYMGIDCFKYATELCMVQDSGQHSAQKIMYVSLEVSWRIEIKDLRGNPKPRVSPDRTKTGPGSGNIFKNIFGSSRVGEFYFGSVRVGEFYFGSVRVGVFFTGAWDIFSQDFGDKLAFHSQTVEVEWLLSLISMLFDVITSLQGIFTCLL